MSNTLFDYTDFMKPFFQAAVSGIKRKRQRCRRRQRKECLQWKRVRQDGMLGNLRWKCVKKGCRTSGVKVTSRDRWSTLWLSANVYYGMHDCINDVPQVYSALKFHGNKCVYLILKVRLAITFTDRKWARLNKREKQQFENYTYLFLYQK